MENPTPETPKSHLNKTLAVFSYVFHPLFVSVYAVVVFFFLGNSYYTYPQIYLVIIQIIIITIFIPVTFYYFLLSLGKVDSVMLSQTSQRKIPLLIHAVLLVILLQKSITIDDLPELHFFFLASLISTTLALILVFFKLKVSLHMIAITALTVFTIGVSLHYHTRLVGVIVALIVCNGFVASSRLSMKAHTGAELVLGSLIGILPQAAILYFWL